MNESEIRTAVIEGTTGTMLDLMDQSEREALAGVKPTVADDAEATEKTCTQCGKTFPIDFFYRVVKTGTQRRSICKECYSQTYYHRSYVPKGSKKAEKATDEKAAATELVAVVEVEPEAEPEVTVEPVVVEPEPKPTKRSKKSKKAEQEEETIHIAEAAEELTALVSDSSDEPSVN